MTTSAAVDRRSSLPLLTKIGQIGVMGLILTMVFDRHVFRVLAEVEPDSIYVFQRFIILQLTDVMLLVAGLIGLLLLAIRIRDGWRYLPAGVVGSIAVGIVATVALVAVPQQAGLVFWARLVLGIGVLVLISDYGTKQYHLFFLAPLTVVVAIEAVSALLQVFVFDNGLDGLWQQTGTDGSAPTAGYGTITGPYQLALLLTVGTAILLASTSNVRRQWWMVLPTGIAMLAVSTTYGRTGAVAVAFVGGTYLIAAVAKRSSINAIKSAIVFVPFSIGVLLTVDPWLEALGKTTGSISIDRASSGRIELMQTAIDMIIHRPVLGYGLRQWMTGLADVRTTWRTSTQVHNVPLLAGAEMGVAALAIFIVWYAVLFVRAIRTSVGATAIFLSALPVLLLDKMTLNEPTMMVVAVLWVAALDHHWLEKRKNQGIAVRGDHESEEPQTGAAAT